jgi:hypothetical protein
MWPIILPHESGELHCRFFGCVIVGMEDDEIWTVLSDQNGLPSRPKLPLVGIEQQRTSAAAHVDSVAVEVGAGDVLCPPDNCLVRALEPSTAKIERDKK